MKGRERKRWVLKGWGRGEGDEREGEERMGVEGVGKRRGG